MKVTKKKPTPSALRKKKASQRIRKKIKQKLHKKAPSWQGALRKSYTTDMQQRNRENAERRRASKRDRENNNNDDDNEDEDMRRLRSNDDPDATEVQDEVDPERMKRLNERDPLETQLFLKGLPVDVTEEELLGYLTPFGPVRRVLVVRNRITKVPTGTAFVHCGTEQLVTIIHDAAQQNAREASASAKAEQRKSHEGMSRHQSKRAQYKLKKDTIEQRDPFITVRGIRVSVHRVLSRTDSFETTAEAKKRKKRTIVAGDDPRNLYLVMEGRIEPGTPAAADLPPNYVNAMERDHERRLEQLRNSNYFVSKLRLNVRNIPKPTTEKDLRTLFSNTAKEYLKKNRVDMDKSKWGKYGPIKNVKLLKDSGGVSRGYGFVEFVNHNVALHTLRVLNNNPTIYGAQKRLRVSFAIEDINAVQKLARIRELKKTRRANGNYGGGSGDGEEDEE